MTTPRRPPGRYDQRRGLPSGPVLLAAGGVLGALLLVAAYAAFVHLAGRTATAGVDSYTVVSDTLVEVRFEVSKAAGSTTYCRVRARDAGGTEVGGQYVRVGPAPSGTVAQTFRLRTTSRANTGEVDGCVAHAP